MAYLAEAFSELATARTGKAILRGIVVGGAALGAGVIVYRAVKGS